MRVAIIGRTEVLYETAERLAAAGHGIGVIVTAKEAPEYTKTAKDFRTLAKKMNAPFFETGDIQSIAGELRKLPPVDIGVSMHYTGIIPQPVIDGFRLGIVNAHGGDLPRYRGNACQAWAILQGEERIGLCIHKMIGGRLDSGDIIVREYFPLRLETKITEVHAWMGQRIPALFETALTALARDPGYALERHSEHADAGFRCYPRQPEDGRIDWSQSARDILRLINASGKPYAGAFCQYEGENFIIWDAALSEDDERFLAVPGQVTAIGEGFIDVAAGEGKLRIRQVEYRGKCCPPSEVIRSIRKRLSA